MYVRHHFLKCISNSHISISFLFIRKLNNKYLHVLPQPFPRKKYPIPDQNQPVNIQAVQRDCSQSRPKWAKFFPFSDRNGPKIIPFEAVHTYDLDKGVPPPEFPQSNCVSFPGGDSNIKLAGGARRKINDNPPRRAMWVWLMIKLTPKGNA